jgi:hypothetical protein
LDCTAQGPAPCAGENYANGPNRTDSIVGVSGITPDQQFQAGLFCGGVYANPTTPIRPNPIAHSIASHNLFDIGVGHDNIFRGDKYKMSARLTVVNLTNKEALDNFISTFSGIHLHAL